MKIYTVRVDSNNYQRFRPDNDEIWKTDRLKMNCTRKLSAWEPPEVYVYNPALAKGNFFHLTSGAFVTDAVATEQLRDLLEMAGELLHLPYKGETYALLNVTECVDALDEEKTEWELGKTTEAKVRIIRHVFKPKRLPESSIFKIPQQLATIYVSEGRKDPEDEFKFRVEQSGLKGLLFEQIWSDED